MFNALKEPALEIDSKIRTLRKKCTTFATGYVEADESIQHSVREKLTLAGHEPRQCIADCDRLVEQTHALFTLLTEADKVADEVYDSVIKLFHAQRVEVPAIDFDTIAVGFPVNLLPLPDTNSVDRSDEESYLSGEEHNSTNASEGISEEAEPEVYISRALGEESLAPETPMVKSRKRLF